MDIFSAGDTAWVLICSLLVLLMSIPAVAFFYGGLSKRKNVLNTMFLTFIAFSIVSVIWVIFGYQFAFGTPLLGGFIGSPSNFFLSGIGLDDLSGTIPTLLFVMFQLAFAGLTAALISGGVVGTGGDGDGDLAGGVGGDSCRVCSCLDIVGGIEVSDYGVGAGEGESGFAVIGNGVP